jgi:hypothetical protein
MLAKAGFVKGVGRVRASDPKINLTGDPYFTDGFRAVLIIDEGPFALDQVQALGWEEPKASLIGSGSEPLPEN